MFLLLIHRFILLQMIKDIVRLFFCSVDKYPFYIENRVFGAKTAAPWHQIHFILAKDFYWPGFFYRNFVYNILIRYYCFRLECCALSVHYCHYCWHFRICIRLLLYLILTSSDILWQQVKYILYKSEFLPFRKDFILQFTIL